MKNKTKQNKTKQNKTKQNTTQHNTTNMGKKKKTKKIGLKKMLSLKDARIKRNKGKSEAVVAAQKRGRARRHVEQAPSSLFFKYNTSLGPPYRILVDTNFINFSIQNKLDICRAMMDCLLARASHAFRTASLRSWKSLAQSTRSRYALPRMLDFRG